VLGFVGLKMILEFFHFEVSTALSLLVVVLLIGGGVLLSVVKRAWGSRAKRKNSDSGATAEAEINGSVV
jgi:predicted tellurium resistance membrane protein TerC